MDDGVGENLLTCYLGAVHLCIDWLPSHTATPTVNLQQPASLITLHLIQQLYTDKVTQSYRAEPRKPS